MSDEKRRCFWPGARVRVENGSDFAKPDPKHNPCKRV